LRVYAVADIHGKHKRFERVRDNLLRLKADLLVVAGDITNYTKPGVILSGLNALPVPVLVIRGNSDLKRVDRLLSDFPNCVPTHAVCTMVKAIPFVGISGTLPIPFRSRISLNESRVLKKIEPLVNIPTVLITHTPPYGCQDRVMGRFHAGSKGLLKLIKQRQPQLVLSGHIHEDGGMSMIGKTHVVNCALSRNNAGAFIRFEDEILAGLEMI
jgi:uncharacterized protein